MFLQLFQHFFCFFLHVGEAGSFRKPLKKEEEQACFEAMEAGDRSAREKLILHNMRLVAHIIKKYGMPQPEQEELISIGTIGLVKAVDSFDCSKGARFATYASRCIENEILMNFRAKKKHADQIYMGEPIETDGDGNQLTLMDIIDDGTDAAGNGGYADAVEAAVPVLAAVPHPAGNGNSGAAVRAVWLCSYDTAGSGEKAGNFAVVHFTAGKTRH